MNELSSAIAAPESAPPTAKWRDSKWLIVAEIIVVALIFIADWKKIIPVSKTPVLLAFAWLSLWLRKVRWRDVGLRLYKNWPTTLALGLACGLALEFIELFVTQPLLVKFLHKPPDLDTFSSLRGNWKLTLVFIGLAWTLAAFGEEMVYRGYLMNRVADFFNRTRRAWLISLILVHVGFGLAHIYQGATGAIDEGLMGVLLGLIYLRTGRSLPVPIVAHGVSDTVDFILMFLGKYPGM